MNANLIKLVHSVHSPLAVLERFSQWDISSQAWVNIRRDKILQMFKMSRRSEKQLAVRKCLLVASLREGPLHGTRPQCVFGVCLSSYESASGETAVCFGKRFVWHLAQIPKMLWVILQQDLKCIFLRKDLKSQTGVQILTKSISCSFYLYAAYFHVLQFFPPHVFLSKLFILSNTDHYTFIHRHWSWPNS